MGMKMKKNILLTSILFCLITSSVFSQGRTISKDSANTAFGRILFSISIQSDSLSKFMGKSNSVIMFKILENHIYILDNKRNVLLPPEGKIDSTEVFSEFSIDVINNLLKSGKNIDTFIEQRNKVLTITNGELTSEFAILCPPFCD